MGRYPFDSDTDLMLPPRTPRSERTVRSWLRRHAWLAYALTAAAATAVYLFGPDAVNVGPVYNAIGLSAVSARRSSVPG